MTRKSRSITNCGYCKSFFESSKRFNDNGINVRRCDSTGGYVSDDDNICEYFILHNYIWCIKCECWKKVKVCTHKYQNKIGECLDCVQGRLVKFLVNQGIGKEQ